MKTNLLLSFSLFLFFSLYSCKDDTTIEPSLLDSETTENIVPSYPPGTYPIPPADLRFKSEAEIQYHLQPMINAGKYKLLQYGFEPTAWFSDPNDPRFAEVAMAFDRLEQIYAAGNEVMYDPINPPIRGLSALNTYDCALRAVGVEAVVLMAQKGFQNVPKTVMRRAVMKIASRTIGWVGAAWATYEFGSCMGWY
jgi:hypothetical protein